MEGTSCDLVFMTSIKLGKHYSVWNLSHICTLLCWEFLPNTYINSFYFIAQDGLQNEHGKTHFIFSNICDPTCHNRTSETSHKTSVVRSWNNEQGLIPSHKANASWTQLDYIHCLVLWTEHNCGKSLPDDVTNTHICKGHNYHFERNIAAGKKI